MNQPVKVVSRSALFLSAFMLPFSTAVTNIFFYLALFLFLVSGRWGQKIQLVKQQRFLQITLLFLSVIWLSTFYSMASWHVAIAHAAKYNKLLLIWLLLDAMETPEQLKRYFCFLAAGISIAIGISLCSWLFPNHLLPFVKDFLMEQSIFRDRQLLGSGANVLAFTVLFLLPRTASYRLRLGYIAGLLILFYFVFFQNISRDSYLTSGLIALYYLWFFYTKHRSFFWGFLASVCVLFTSAVLFSSSMHERYSKAHTDLAAYQQGDYDSSLGYRLTFLHHTLSIYAQHPILGAGIGGFSAEEMRLGVQKKWAEHSGQHPHNEFLKILTEQGPLGLMLFIYWLSLSWRLRNQKQPYLNQLGKSVVLVFVPNCLIFFSGLSDFGSGFLLCQVAGIAQQRKQKP